MASDTGALTLNEPSSPDRVVQTDLVSPKQPQTLKRLPLGGDYLTTVRKKISFVVGFVQSLN